MTGRHRLPIHVAVIAAALCMAGIRAEAQNTPPEGQGGDHDFRARQARAAAAARQPTDASMNGPANPGINGPANPGMNGLAHPAMNGLANPGVNGPVNAGQMGPKPSAGVPVTAPEPQPSPKSMLDQPASAARIQLNGDQLAIEATNASLSEVLRQVAARTGMLVEGNSRDERVFGNYGPGSPSDVLSALLYASGYNVMMVGSNEEGAPRRLVLSNRPAGPVGPAATQPVKHDEEDDEAPAEAAPPPPPPPSPNPQITPGPATGQPKTPQQMLEELQRMHQGEQSTDSAHTPQPQ